MASELRTVLVVGTGLIGTSVALALRGQGVRVLLADRDQGAMRLARELGAGEEWHSAPSAGTHGADAPPAGTYGGLYQFDTETWQRLGGRGRPQDAPPAEQTMRAKKLYVRQGTSPWPHCGQRLHG